MRPLRRPQRPLWAMFLRPGLLLVVGTGWTLARLVGRGPLDALVGAVLATVLVVLVAGGAE